jgi:hypothetical protein
MTFAAMRETLAAWGEFPANARMSPLGFPETAALRAASQLSAGFTASDLKV